MTLDNIILLALEKLNLKEDEPIIKSLTASINEGYVKLNKINPAIATSYIPIINKVAKLPENLVEIINITPALLEGDRQIGNNIVTANTGTLEVLHSFLFDPLESLEDEPALPLFLHSSLSNYACYSYLININPNLASGYLNDFEKSREEYKATVNKSAFAKNSIKDYYSEFCLGSDF